MKRFVICGTPRSGSKYIAELINKIGIGCGHELIFNRWNGKFQQTLNWNLPLWGVSGFASAPFVKDLDSSYVVLIQKRDKQKTIDSLKRIGILYDFKTRFARHYFNYINFHCGEPWLKSIKNYQDRLEAFYDRWYKLAEDRADYTYNIEDLDTDKLIEILRLIQAPELITEDRQRLQRILEGSDKKTNHAWPGEPYY